MTRGKPRCDDGRVTGSVEDAVRRAVSPRDLLTTPSGRGQFTVAEYTAHGIVLLLGAKQARTPLPWQALEQVPDFVRGRGWVLIGSVYSTDGTPGSLDAHLKTFLMRATAGWIAVVLEKAGVITLDRAPPRASNYVQAGSRSSRRGTRSARLG
jgi:hypothetical protein